MPVGLIPALLGVSILIAAASGFYLLFNARAVAIIFSRPDNELVPGPGRRQPSRGRMLAAMALFGAALGISLLIWSFGGAEPVSDAVESHPAEVQRP